jgi:hypothetical protein
MLRKFFVFLIAATLVSCRNDVYSPNSCYNDKVKAIIVSNCTGSGCHNTKDHARRLDLTSYEGTMRIVTPGHPLRSDLYKVITKGGDGKMPPDHSLTQQEITAIKGWISFGAHNNDCGVSCDTSNITFSGAITDILQSNCTGCHSSGNVILTNYNNVKSYAASGALMNAINRTGANQEMPPSYKLSDCEIRTLAIWISAGMPND